MKGRERLRQVMVSVSAEAEEAILELLGSIFGQQASFYSNAETGAQLASVYLSKPSDWNRARQQALAAGLENLQACGLDIGPGTISSQLIEKEDWAESWKKHFPPMEIGDVLLVRPSWSKRRPKRGQKEIILDPGLSFGTGHHATTRYCLEELAAFRGENAGQQSFLDIGTGTGILAIAAARLGFSPVEAFDFDPEAVKVARANATQNLLGERLRISRKDLTALPARSARRYSLICANLIVDLLLSQKRRIINRLKPEGQLVLAGILTTQFEEIRKGFEEAGMKLVRRKADGEWESGSFLRAR